MIAIEQFSNAGAKIFSPDGPFGNNTPPLAQFKFGTVVDGDCEAEYVYLALNVVAGITLQQGQLIAWDTSFQAYLPTTALALRGDSIGSFFLGGRVGDPGGLPASQNWPFSVTLSTPGTYGIWVQRAGAALLQISAAAVTAPAQANTVTTTTVAGFADAPAASVGKVIQGLYIGALSQTFTATTTIGSAILTAVSTLRGVEVGMGISGTGIPAGCYVQAINGNTVTLGNYLAAGSALATASATNTMTVAKGAFTANTVTGSPVLTNVSNIAGIYPGSSLTTTVAGFAVGATVLSISGNSGSGYQITMSANATGTNTSAAFSFVPIIGAGVLSAVEAEFRWPYIQ